MAFIARVTAHAAVGIMAQVMAWDDPYDIHANKVGAWLLNEEATEWEEVGWIELPADGYDY